MNSFIDHINLIESKFSCFKAGHLSDKSSKFLIDLTNKLSPPASLQEINILKSLIPEPNDLIRFYTIHNGIQLYCNNHTIGVEFFKINELKKQNTDYKNNELKYNTEDGVETFEYEKNGVIFGGIPFSRSFFVMYKNMVYSTEIGLRGNPIGLNFKEFLNKMLQNPAKFLQDMGSYTRYYDDKTDAQWIAEKFISKPKT